MMNASILDDIRCARLEFPEQKYLVQTHIDARIVSGRQAWFRVFYVGGDCIPCWRHPITQVYRVLTSDEETRFDLALLRKVTEGIAHVCKLDWFPTEIAQTEDSRFVIVD